MKWLARLKKIKIAPEVEPTKPTKPGFVGFVGFIPAPIQKTEGNSPAANDPTAVMPDPDRWCWPHSEGMTSAEIDTFTARLARFTDKGVNLNEGEALADRLVTRDRESDDRRLCLECFHLACQFGKIWSCRNGQRARVAIKPQHAQLPAALVTQLQRCDGFKDSN